MASTGVIYTCTRFKLLIVPVKLFIEKSNCQNEIRGYFNKSVTNIDIERYRNDSGKVAHSTYSK